MDTLALVRVTCCQQVFVSRSVKSYSIMSRKLAANGKLGLKKIIVNFADVLLRRNDRIEGIRIGMAIFTQKIIE